MDWNLFVDETGDFSLAERDVAVAALLLPRGALLARVEDVLRPVLRSCYPWMPWPLHGRVLESPGCQLAFASVHAEDAVDDPLGRALCDAAKALSPRSHPAWAPVLDRVRAGREPRMVEAQELDRALPAVLGNRGFAEIRHQVRSRHRGLLRAARETLREALPAGFVEVAGAMEVEVGALTGAPDRYLALLQEVISRAAALLIMGKGPGLQRLFVSPLQRKVRHPLLGQQAHMDHQLLQEQIRQALGGGSPVERAGRRVEIHADSLQAFGQEDLSVGHVLADLLASRVRIAAGRRSARFSDVTGRFREATHFELETAASPPLPTLAAATGTPGPRPWAADAVREGPSSKGWPSEQYRRWETAIQAGRTS